MVSESRISHWRSYEGMDGCDFNDDEAVEKHDLDNDVRPKEGPELAAKMML